MPEIATRTHLINAFKVMEVLASANRLRAAGHPVIDMEVGEPDFPTPAPIVAAGQQALADGLTRYTDAVGIMPLRERIRAFYRSDYDLDVALERIHVTAGGSGALLLTTALLTNPGDGWLMTDPGYPCNRNFVLAVGGEPQLVPVTAASDYQLTAARVAEAWQDNTRVVLLASPSNPTGSVVAPDEMRAIAEVVAEHDGWLVVDEIYHGLVYDERSRHSALALGDHVICLNSFSKYFGMTGWRLGWMVVPEPTCDALARLAQNLFICPSAIAQHAALAAFDAPAREVMEANRAEMKQRRDFLVPALRDLGFAIPSMPAGAFYVYTGLPGGFDDAEDFCRQVLSEQYVAITPGTDFGDYHAADHLRFSYAQPLASLEEAISRLVQVVR